MNFTNIETNLRNQIENSPETESGDLEESDGVPIKKAIFIGAICLVASIGTVENNLS